MVARRLRRAALTALAALVVVLVPAAARGPQIALTSPDEAAAAGGSAILVEGEVGESGVRYSGSYAWPASLRRGWFPVSLTLRNTREDSVVVRLLAEQSFGEEDRVTRRVSLAPGERVDLELLLRARTNALNQYVLELTAAGERVRVSGLSPGNHGVTGAPHEVLHVSGAPPAAGSQERWSQSWLLDPARAVPEAAHRHGHQHDPAQGQVTARTFADLSTNWQAYTSLDTVVLDLAGGSPGEARFDALLAWCRTGGRLCLLGVPLAELRENEELAPLLEERLAVEVERPADFATSGLRAFALGFGYLIVHDEPAGSAGIMEPVGSAPALALVADRAALGPSWMRRRMDAPTRLKLALDTLTEFEGLPLRGLMILLVAFALVLGPVNFYWVRRRGRPLLLLLTVPGLSVAMSLGLLAYGILSQGLDIKARVRSYSVLDQRDQRAVAAEARRILAGSSPGAGLRPEPGTAVVPEEDCWQGSWRGEHLFAVDLTDGRLLGGDYLPVRQPIGQLVLSERTSHLRLEARLGAGGVEVVNGLGAEVLELLLRAPDGSYHELRAPLAEGATGSLASAGAQGPADHAGDLIWFGGDGRARPLAPGTYLARLDRHVLRDDLGIEVHELSGGHLLLGVLEGREEAWR